MSPVDILLVSCGLALILVALGDIVFTVLHYEGYSFLSARLFRLESNLMRSAARVLPPTWRSSIHTLTVPLMVPTAFIVWMALHVAGFGLIYLTAMNTGTRLCVDTWLRNGGWGNTTSSKRPAPTRHTYATVRGGA